MQHAKKSIYTAVLCFSIILFCAVQAIGRKYLYGKNSYRALPKEYNFLVEHMRTWTDKIYMYDLQHSGGDRASFNSLGLIFFNAQQYPFLKTGFAIKPVGNDKMGAAQVTKVHVLASNKWSGANVVDFDKYDPRNNVTNFFYMKHFLNITDAQLLAHFINSIDGYRWNNKKKNEKVATISQKELEKEKGQNKTNQQIFIRQISKVNHLTIDDVAFEKSGKTLTDLCAEINKQMPKSDCGFSGYKTYIEDKDEKITRSKINLFYRGLTTNSLEETTNELMLPRGEIEFAEPKLNLVLPIGIFDAKENGDQVEFSIFKLTHQLTYDYSNYTYVLKVSILPFFRNPNAAFSFKGTRYDVLKGKDVTEVVNVPENTLTKMEFLIYPDKMNVNAYFKQNGYETSYRLSKDFSLK